MAPKAKINARTKTEIEDDDVVCLDGLDCDIVEEPPKKKAAKRADKSPPISQLPPQMRGCLQSLAVESEIIPKDATIGAQTSIQSVVTALERRGIKQLASYLRLVSMRVMPTRELLTSRSRGVN